MNATVPKTHTLLEELIATRLRTEDRSVGAARWSRRFTEPRMLQFKALPPAEASKDYRGGLEEISRYFEKMETPRPLIDAMLATSSSEIRWIDSWDDKLESPPSFEEWIDASCGSFTM